MKEILIKILKYGFAAIFVAAFLWLARELFFSKEGAKILNTNEKSSQETLRVLYSTKPISLEPTFSEPAVRQRLLNIFEPLVKLDRDMKPVPALATSWGLIDDQTWVIKLRENVKFHDGSKFDAKDVVASINRARENPNSQISGILDSIELVEILDGGQQLHIITTKPDPLLLQRLSLVLIFPAEFEKEKIVPLTGTASYKFTQEDGSKIILTRFENYWGEKSKFAKVELLTAASKKERVDLFLGGGADLMEYVPFEVVDLLKERKFNVTTIPSLEVQFLLFNTNSDFFAKVEARQAVSLALDQEAFVKSVSSYARPVNQFVSNGIFGFDPDLSDHEYDLEKAKTMIKEAGLQGQILQFHVSKDMQILGEYVRTQLNQIGIEVLVSYLDGDKLLESLQKAQADVYFFGFKSDLGDSGDFLDLLVQSEGEYNFLKYKNEEVDSLIEKGMQEMDQRTRLNYLQQAMEAIVDKDVFGVPLFEYELVYAFNDKVDFEPRIDGFIYFDDLKIK